MFGTSTSSSTASTYTGSPEYPVFPNARYISKFYLVSSQYSGLTDLDIDLYNECYLPARALPHHEHDKRDETTSTLTNKPDYRLDDPPCKRQAAINANCYYENTNGTFAGMKIYSDKWDVQQQCYCDIYPFFDSSFGCQECFKQHGGIEGTFLALQWPFTGKLTSVADIFQAITGSLRATSARYPALTVALIPRRPDSIHL